MDTSVDLASPADIERPRSALHSGDFSEGSAELQDRGKSQPSSPRCNVGSPFPQLGSSPTTPWYNPSIFATCLHRHVTPVHCDRRIPAPNIRARAPSLGSFSSSYVLKAPTTPLVHQANNTDLDFSPKSDAMDMSGSQEKINRRRTLPPNFQNSHFSHSAQAPPIDFRSAYPSEMRNSLPYQSHYPRRYLTSAYSLQLASSVQTPVPRSRRPSFASEKSHAPLVGSYEESILRGRMSMNPSKPLDFTAQIGVLGKGKSKSNLKCPPHVTVPFPAVFYSYPTSGLGRSISDDNPSPYVGLIDLENSLPKDEPNSNRRRRRHRSPGGLCGDQITNDVAQPRSNDAEARRLREKKNRRSESPKCPPGGCYRIPQQGQLQIMIKNPNKTAVKLFLVPYDLSDMEPGTKTFIRQRSYSAGPIIDMPLSARTNYGTDRPEASLNISEDPKDKPILRYLIHLNICCPSKGRFYLHSSIRVVFANRVPDSQEKLRNEIQHPDPRYTPYKPSRDANVGSKSVAEKPSRRRSVGQGSVQGSLPSDHGHPAQPSDQFYPPTARDMSPPSASTKEDHRCMVGKTPLPFQPIPALRESPFSWRPDSSPSQSSDPSGRASRPELYHKLSRGDTGYGGSEAGESLLAKRLKGLDVQRRESYDLN